MVPYTSDVLQEIDLVYQPGDKVADRYLIEKHIGKGGMGVVYCAQDQLMNERVALKFLNPRLLRTQRGQKSFIQEALVARRLRHENIVAVHDISTTAEGVLYLSMELMEGQSLRTLFRRRREERKLLDVRLAISVTTQILSALEYAHRTVIHRDLKPENVMLLAGERAKVLDFGLAKAVEEEAATPAVDQDPNRKRRVVGTLAYASPEQKRHHPLDPRSDLYAVGLIFYELLTLRSPLDQYADVRQVRRDISPSLLSIMEKALRDDREIRWATANEFRQALLDAYDQSYRRSTPATVVSVSGRKVSTQGMVYFEGGSFLMGSDQHPEEAPEHEVSVMPFYMDKHPVTVAQYREFLKETKRPEPPFWDDANFSGDSQPVVGVTWHEAMAYAAWAGKQLPSEIQWEYAARGRDNRVYPWGNREPDPIRCNFGDHLNMPSLVGMHEEGATPEGIEDLAGNVFEWTRDLFVPYDASADSHSDVVLRAVRGGSWHSPATELRGAARTGLFPETRESTVGFRCVFSPEAAKNPAAS